MRIPRAGERRWVAAVSDARYLGRRESHHLDIVAVSKHDVEIMEVATGGAADDDASFGIVGHVRQPAIKCTRPVRAGRTRTPEYSCCISSVPIMPATWSGLRPGRLSKPQIETGDV